MSYHCFRINSTFKKKLLDDRLWWVTNSKKCMNEQGYYISAISLLTMHSMAMHVHSHACAQTAQSTTWDDLWSAHTVCSGLPFFSSGSQRSECSGWLFVQSTFEGISVLISKGMPGIKEPTQNITNRFCLLWRYVVHSPQGAFLLCDTVQRDE